MHPKEPTLEIFWTPGVFHGLKEVAVKEKLPGLYRGVGPTLLAIAPFMAIQQSTYDVLKQQAIQHQLEPSAPLFLVCGSIAGGMAQTVNNPFNQLHYNHHSLQAVYPLDVVRRRMQVQTTGYQRFSLLLKTLHLHELFYGLSATYLKVTLHLHNCNL